MAEHAKESSHWYAKDGSPCYTVIGKNGKERDTTLRDARTMGLVPSVTTIIRQAVAPGLERWKAEQLLLSALTTDRKPDESQDEYVSRIIADSQEQGKKARERGTYIHAVVQGGFEGEPISDDDRIYYESARDTLLKECGEQSWICEKAFATKEFGGKVDLHTATLVVDIKTTQKDLAKIKTWDEHHQQLAAYIEGVCNGEGRGGILYINTDTAESKLLWVSADDLIKGWYCFEALLAYFYAKTGLEV